MANYPQEFAQDAVCQSHTGHMTGLWFLPTRPLRLCVCMSPFPECFHLNVVGGLACLNDLTGYAGGKYMFLVGPPQPHRP